jgi:hypothetical protein
MTATERKASRIRPTTPIDPSKVEIGRELPIERPTDPRVQIGYPSKRR